MEELVSLKHVSKSYSIGKKKWASALCDVSLSISRGQTLGIVGESGSGKSTLARMVMGMEQPDEGEICYRGEPILSNSGKGRLAHAKKAQIIFQDPLASLDPRMTVGSIISEGMEIHNMLDGVGRRQRVAELLAMVGLEKGHAARYPHEFSGGQCQRIGIARALAVNPEFIVCDEPISALDISVQSHMMNLLRELQERLGLTYLFIAHDLNMVHYISDHIAVLYSGKVVEFGSSDEVCMHPRHPYTKLLLDSVLIPDPNRKSLGSVQIKSYEGVDCQTSAVGCGFARTCPLALDRCKEETPMLTQVETGHFSACLFVEADGGSI